MLPDKSAEIVRYCANTAGHSSEMAARELERLDHATIRVYPDGKQGALEADLELEQSGSRCIAPEGWTAQRE